MNKPSKLLLTFISIFSLILGFLAGGLVHIYLNKPESDVVINGDLRIHFLELGNEYAGDSILIEVGETDILIDAGSKLSSLDTIVSYLDKYVSDKTLEYVIVTHAHEDHYANFAGNGETSLFTYYETQNIIQFALTNQTTGKMYNNYLKMVEKEKEEGANVYTALECYKNQKGCTRTTDLGFGVELEILYNHYYENKDSSENNYSVCIMINQGDNHFLFTGDLEDSGEEKLIELNTLPQVTLFKAGHHGSNTSNTAKLLNVIKPEIVVVTAVAGSVEYTQNLDSTFPTKKVLSNIATYTDKVYVTSKATIELKDDKYENTGFSSLNGNIIVNSNKNGVTVNGDNNSEILKNSDWYSNYYSTYRNNDLPWA